MMRIELPKGVWVEVVADTDTTAFILTNYPLVVDDMDYKITYGTSMPSADSDVMFVKRLNGMPSREFGFKNDGPENIYIMAIQTDGAVLY